MLLTYCCNAVLQTAITAAIKPLALTLTSVTVQTATPRRTNVMLSFVSLEYRTLSKTTSRKQDTGIILSLAICNLNQKAEIIVNSEISHKESPKGYSLPQVPKLPDRIRQNSTLDSHSFRQWRNSQIKQI